jgi:hypothetical protein
MKIFILVLFSLSALDLASSQDEKILMDQIGNAYNNINFQTTIDLTTQAIESYETYSPKELILIYKYRAFAYYNLGDEANSMNAFRTLLSLDADTRLDTVTVSPKIINFFKDIKNDIRTKPDSESPVAEIKYLPIYDPRPGAAWRSLVLPGWGQYYEGQKTKSYIIFSSFAISSIGLITSLLKENAAHDAYLNAQTAAEIESKYETYNKWHKTRQIFTYTESVIWLFAFFDALWMPLPEYGPTSLHINANGVTFSYSF